MSMSDSELARALFPKPRQVIAEGTGNADLVTTMRGRATSASSDGTVTVVLDADAMGGTAELEIPTGARISEGDEVLVTVAGNTPVDAVAAGWGDQLMDDVQFSFDQTNNAITLTATTINNSIDSKVSELRGSIGGVSADVQSLAGTVNGNMDTIKSYMSFGVGRDDQGEYPLLILGGGTDAEFSVRISNRMVGFMQDNNLVAYINNHQLFIGSANITESLAIGNWMWIPRANGNLALKWIGGAV